MQEQMTWTEWKAEEAGDQAGDYAEVVEEVAQEETGVELVGARRHCRWSSLFFQRVKFEFDHL